MTAFFSEGEIRPSTNETQEAMRRLPSGVKKLFLRIDGGDRLDREPAVILAWMHAHGLAHTPAKGVHEGRMVLTTLGKKVHKALERRMEGRE